MNRARTDEQADIQAALTEMVAKGVPVYRHAKIELVRVPGAEKLRVRVTKEEGDAGAEDLEPPGGEEPAGEGEPGDLGVAARREAALEG